MLIKNLIDEDFVNYKKPSMFIAMPHCTFKCDKECGCQVCQNSELANADNIDIELIEIANRFYNNSITEAIVFGGLEPFDDFDDMYNLILLLQQLYIVSFDIKIPPDIVIYTGYYPDEIEDKLGKLKEIKDLCIVVKFGRFIPDKPSHYDELLGVELASDNQYAMRLEDCFK